MNPKNVEQKITNKISEVLKKYIDYGCVTTSISSKIEDNNLTIEKLSKAVQDIYGSLPSFDLLDQMIEQGYNINELVLIIYSEVTIQKTLMTKHGELKVMGSPYANVKNAYLMPVPDYRYMKLEL